MLQRINKYVFIHLIPPNLHVIMDNNDNECSQVTHSPPKRNQVCNMDPGQLSEPLVHFGNSIDSLGSSVFTYRLPYAPCGKDSLGENS